MSGPSDPAAELVAEAAAWLRTPEAIAIACVEALERLDVSPPSEPPWAGRRRRGLRLPRRWRRRRRR